MAEVLCCCEVAVRRQRVCFFREIAVVGSYLLRAMSTIHPTTPLELEQLAATPAPSGYRRAGPLMRPEWGC